MLKLVGGWRTKAKAIRATVKKMEELEVEKAGTNPNPLDLIGKAPEQAHVVEDALLKVASVYNECADALEEKLWED